MSTAGDVSLLALNVDVIYVWLVAVSFDFGKGLAVYAAFPTTP